MRWRGENIIGVPTFVSLFPLKRRVVLKTLVCSVQRLPYREPWTAQ